jgi:hypothetical protein
MENSEEQEERGAKVSLHNELIDLISGDVTEFLSTDDEVYIDIKEGETTRTFHEDSPELKRKLQSILYREKGKILRDDSYKRVKEFFGARAHHSGRVHSVHLRSYFDGEKVFYNLANANGEVVVIDYNGWEIKTSTIIKFHKTKSMLANVTPSPLGTGDINLLKRYINYETEDQWYLIVIWLVSTCYRAPYAILLIIGQQGTAKSSSSKALINSIDPCVAVLNSKPRKEQDVFISATNRHVLAFDNISGINTLVSDTLCRLSTGAGIEVRKLHSDADQKLFYTANPMLLNGIDEIASRGDLMSRSIFINLPVIPAKERKSESEIDKSFEVDRPKILSAIFDILSAALKNLPNVNLRERPRMADFAEFGCAASEAIGITPKIFMQAYTQNMVDANQRVLELDPVALAITKLMENNSGLWSGNATELLSALDRFFSDSLRRANAVPSVPASMAKKLNRIIPMLKLSGIEVDFSRAPGLKTYTISKSLNDSNDGNDA